MILYSMNFRNEAEHKQANDIAKKAGYKCLSHFLRRQLKLPINKPEREIWDRRRKQVYKKVVIEEALAEDEE